MNKVVIQLSKKKILLMILGSFAFVALGIFMFVFVASGQSLFYMIFIKGIGIFSIVFFGAMGLYSLFKLLDSSAGMVIDDNGIFDNSNALSAGFIKWSDITEVETFQSSSTKILLVHTKDPHFYLSKSNMIKRKFMNINYKMYGTPLTIVSTTLKCKFDDLEQLVLNGLEKYQLKN